MNVDRFLYQVQQNLPKHEGVITWIEESAVKVGYGDTVSFEIRYPGGVCYNAATEKTEEFDRLVEEADKTFKTVKEYIDLMDKSPKLTARDFNMPYKLLAEFNGVVLGGIEHRSNRSFEFTTWSYRDNALYHGHYYSDYESAKEDFAVRSGLTSEKFNFTPKELIETYKCISEALELWFEMSDEQVMTLQDVQCKIRQNVPNIDAELRDDEELEDAQECEQEFGQSM